MREISLRIPFFEVEREVHFSCLNNQCEKRVCVCVCDICICVLAQCVPFPVTYIRSFDVMANAKCYPQTKRKHILGEYLVCDAHKMEDYHYGTSYVYNCNLCYTCQYGRTLFITHEKLCACVRCGNDEAGPPIAISLPYRCVHFTFTSWIFR